MHRIVDLLFFFLDFRKQGFYAEYFSVFIKRQSCHHIETTQLTSFANQLIGFSMVATLAFNESIILTHFWIMFPFETP